MHHLLCVRTLNAFIAVFQDHKSNGKGIRKTSKSTVDLLYAYVCASVLIIKCMYVPYGCASEVQDIRHSHIMPSTAGNQGRRIS